MKHERKSAIRNAAPKPNLRVGERIVNGLKSFVEAIESGKNLSGSFTCRNMVLDLKPIEHKPKSVKAIRDQLNVSQTLFAQLLGVKPSTVQSWEQGRQAPGDMACRFLDEIRRDPEYWRKRVAKALRAKTPRMRTPNKKVMARG
jgi:putative transcriptional regulator